MSVAMAASSRSSGRMPSDHRAPHVAGQRRMRAERLVRQRQALLADHDPETAVHALHRDLHHVHGGAADEAGDEQVDGMVVELLRRRHLLQLALAHHGDAVAHGHGLDLVVRHVDGGHAQLVLKAADLGAHLHAQLGVEVGERLVHEEGLGLAHDGAPHGDPLALAAGEGARLALEEVLETEDLRGVAHALVDLILRRLPQTQPEGDVVVDGEVRIERVVLEHHGDVAIARGHVVDDPVADRDRAGRDGLEPGEHTKGRRLAAARRPHEYDELAIGDGEVHVGYGARAVGVDLADPAEGHTSHACHLLRRRALQV